MPGTEPKVTDVIRVACFAHARRYYTDALKALPKGSPKSGTNAHEAIRMIGQMFDFEEALAEEENLTPKLRKRRREEGLQPLMTAYFAWVKTMAQNTIPKSAFAKALNYSLNHQTLLTNILLDGQCELSTNIAEQQIKPFVVARKNFLFCKTANGAKASAVAFSLVQSAKLNQLNPYEYLKHVFEQLPNIDCTNEEALKSFLPWSDQLPDICRQSLAQTNQA